MAGTQNPQGLVCVDGVVSGLLKVGLLIDGIAQRGFSLREATVDDLLEAEMESDVTKPLNFSAQLMVRQLVQVGDFKGPFTINMIRRLKPVDWRILRDAQGMVDALGEAGPASAKTS